MAQIQPLQRGGNIEEAQRSPPPPAASGRRCPVHRRGRARQHRIRRGLHEDFKIGYPSLSNSSDQVALEFSQVIPDTAFPSTLIISRNQRITGRIIGQASASNLSNLIQKPKNSPSRKPSGRPRAGSLALPAPRVRDQSRRCPAASHTPKAD